MSIDLKMAWRNIWRNPRRTLLTVTAITFACLLLVFMLSFQFGTYETIINSAVKIQTGHLQIQAEEYRKNMDIRRVVSDPKPAEDMLKNTQGVSAFTCRATAFSLISSKSRTFGGAVIGIDPKKERETSRVAALIREGDFLEQGDTDRALIGRLLAENLDVTIGDELTVLGQGLDGSVAATVVTVKGIYASGQDEFDRSAIQIPLSYFQDVYFMGNAVHQIVVVADSLTGLSRVKAQIASRLSEIIDKNPQKYPLVVLDWKEIMPGLMQAISMDMISGLIFWVILIIVVAFSILNTFLMAVFERTREFGVMMAVGTKPGRLTRLVLTESFFMTLLGVAAGIVSGCLLTLYFQAHGIDFGNANELLLQYGISGRMYPRLSFLTALLGPGLVMIITVIAALYPALKIRKLRPVEAMTHV